MRPPCARLVGLALAASALCSPVVHALDPARAPSQYVHDQWEVEDGLPQSSVFSLIQGRQGYLWAATEEGLVRFDGVRFTVYDARASPLLELPYLWSVAEDEQGVLWLGGDRAGVLRMQEGAIRQVLPFAEVGGAVKALARGAGGVMWVGSTTGRLYRCQGQQATLVQTLPSAISGLVEGTDGVLWITTVASGLIRRAPDGSERRFTRQEGLPSDNLLSVHLTASGELWVGASGAGVAVLREGRFTNPDRDGLLAHRFVTGFGEDAAGTVWVGVHDGLFRFRDARFEALPLGGPVYTDSVIEDREGNVWLGTQGAGLHRLRNGRILPIGPPEGLPADIVWSVAETIDGSRWLSLMGGGVTVLSPEGGMRQMGPGQGLPPVTVYSLYADPAGGVWMGTEGRGLLLVEGDRVVRHITAQDGLVSSSVLSLLKDRRGRLWVGTPDAGISIQQEQGWRSVTTADGLPEGYVFVLHQDRTGRVWAGLGGGLAQLDEEGRVVRVLTTRDGLPDDAASSIVEDDDGTLWIASQRGLARLTPDDRIARWTSQQGLHQDGILRLLDDGLGHLWMSSNKGVFRVARTELAAVARGERARVTPLVLGRLDGMRTAECNGGFQLAGTRTSDGRLWFPTVKGVVVVDPAALGTNPIPPPVVVESATIDGHERPGVAELSLEPGRHRLEVRYAGLSLGVPERVRFRHRLLGWDPDWVEAGGERVAHYTGLRPGDYTFQVLAANDHGVWNQTAATLRIRQRPHFWQTWPFLVVCALAIATAGYGSYRVRVRQLRARADELERLVRERTAELASEKETSERLLLNVLPPSIAERLKLTDASIADSFDEATVLFADIVGFTELSARMGAAELVEMLNEVFTSFDHLADRHGLEKIKTIGDAYMVVGGLPVARPDHAHAVAEMALGMREELAKVNASRGTTLDLRIGINTGPVVAGVIGRRKFIYDLWGDAVNTASRMESHGMPGTIQVSESTYRLLAGRYSLESRGVIKVKGKGEMATWMLLGRAPAEADSGEGGRADS